MNHGLTTLPNLLAYANKLRSSSPMSCVMPAIDEALDAFNVRDPFDREVLTCELHCRMTGSNMESDVEVTDKFLHDWANTLRSYAVPSPIFLDRTFNQHDVPIEDRKRLRQKIGHDLGILGQQGKEEVEKERYKDSIQEKFPFPLPFPPMPPGQ